MTTTENQAEVSRAQATRVERVSSPSQNSTASVVPLLSLFTAKQQIQTAAARAARVRAREGDSGLGTLTPGEFTAWAQDVVVGMSDEMGRPAKRWAALTQAERERFGRVVALLVAGVGDGPMDAPKAYEEVRAHERRAEHPTVPWAHVRAEDRMPWVLLEALCSCWRAARGLS